MKYQNLSLLSICNFELALSLPLACLFQIQVTTISYCIHFFCGTGIWPLGLDIFHHLIHAPSSFWFGYFQVRVLNLCTVQAVLQSSYLIFLNSLSDGYVSPQQAFIEYDGLFAQVSLPRDSLRTHWELPKPHLWCNLSHHTHPKIYIYTIITTSHQVIFQIEFGFFLLFFKHYQYLTNYLLMYCISLILLPRFNQSMRKITDMNNSYVVSWTLFREDMVKCNYIFICA
jgi:hypothetical protein